MNVFSTLTVVCTITMALLASAAHYLGKLPLFAVLPSAGVALVAAAVVFDRDRATWRLGARIEQEQGAAARKRVLIVGAGSVGRALARELESDGRHTVVGFADDPGAPGADDQAVLGTRSAVSRIVVEHAIDEVLLAYTPTWQQQLAASLAAHHPQVRVSVVPSPYEALICTTRVESLGDVAVVRVEAGGGWRQEALKRTFDVALASVGLILLGPLVALLAVLVRLTSPGPVFFAQERVGRYGRLFHVYKLRTMRHDAEASSGPVLSSGTSDHRLTAIGRYLRAFRLDEIPQLWNVLRGEMSLVGPRPERPCFVYRFERTIPFYGKRHAVRPGITGLAQVCGGYHTDARDKLRFDLIYAANSSLWMDVVILIRTVLVVFGRRG